MVLKKKKKRETNRINQWINFGLVVNSDNDGGNILNLDGFSNNVYLFIYFLFWSHYTHHKDESIKQPEVAVLLIRDTVGVKVESGEQEHVDVGPHVIKYVKRKIKKKAYLFVCLTMDRPSAQQKVWCPTLLYSLKHSGALAPCN